MEMIPVRSSAIRAVGYDPTNLRMRIIFAEGHGYDFCRVPSYIFEGLLRASSKGGYYNQYIKDRYQC
jgi:KTSC domain